MSELIVLVFKSPTGAQEALSTISDLQKQQLITVADAATVVREADGKPKIKQAHNLVGAGALGGAFWGMLIGLILLNPWLGLAIGAISGAIAGKFSDIGIDDKFIKEVSESVSPGESALFMMVEQWTEDRVVQELQKLQPTVLRTNLSVEDEAKLKSAFGPHD
ncbi:MAG: DUF1269 domain-containing protein [Anaerolineales bacterium]|nr:DUF1269 domain-containing protein [Anaerolineales bacterium]